MSSSTLLRIYAWLLLVIFAGLIVHAPLTVYLGTFTSPEWDLILKAWKELLMVVGLVVAAALLTQQRKWHALLADKLLWLIVGYVVLHLLSLLLWQGWLPAISGLMIDLRYIVFFVLCYVLILVAPQYKSLLLKTAVWGAVVVIGFFVVQLLLPHDSLKYIGYSSETIHPYTTVDRNYDFIRYQSTLRGPNPFGAYTAGVAVIGAAWLTMRRRSADKRIGALAALAVVATYLSYSRSAYLALIVALGLVVAYRYARFVKVWQWACLGVASLALIIGIVAFRDSYIVSNVILHEDPVGGSSISSNDEHHASLVLGINRMLSQPLGAGVGSTGSPSLLGDNPLIIENQYLMVAHEVGWLGLGLFVAIFGIILWRLWQQRADSWALGVFATGVGMAVIGLFLPVWADDTVSMLWWGIAGLLVARHIGVVR